MDLQKEKGAAPDQENAPVKQLRRNTTKKSRILALLKLGTSLNRFEAEQWGDHALNSTIAVLRQEGNNITDEWESVPTRFGRNAMVKRYRYSGVAA